MKRRSVATISIFIVSFVFIVANVYASSPIVIDKEKAGGYQYTVLKVQNDFTWKIGHRDNLFTIQENKDNYKVLQHFRTSVRDINEQIIELTLSSLYLLFVVLTALVLYKKNKQLPKSFGAFIVIVVGIALYFTITNSIELNRAFQDTKFYYSELIN